ncbi:unnamed protein product [Adineta steineri]|uniref:Calponin-homology (CH) domain-containing protein n=1 Tax=Adineta steineri TaxID=433720 RepID=A0A814E130_9BILA|nr:unnamed protein product [Adineta steineri]
MSNTNANVRSLRDKFLQQQQQVNQYDNTIKHQQEQKHDISFQCIHCGKHQTVIFLLQPNLTKDIVQSPVPEYDPVYRSKSIDRDNRPSIPPRQVSIISEEQEELTPQLRQSNYALDFRHSSEDITRPSAVEQNIKGFVNNCVRSSLHDISQGNKDNNNTQEIVEIDIEYDPILGNIKSTRKRSSTLTTNLDNDYHSSTNRPQSVNSRYKLISSDANRDTAPIWARRRISHSTVKPSDLIREHDKKEKLEPTALRRLSRADLVDDSVIPNSTIKPKIISLQNPTMIKDIILRWCQDLTQFYKGVNIRNFSSSWNDGLAFCAIIHRYFPDEFNFETLNTHERRQNFDLAFTVALERAGIEPLIDTDDMIYMGDKPDWKVVFTYVQSLYRNLSRIQPPAIMRERW